MEAQHDNEPNSRNSDLSDKVSLAEGIRTSETASLPVRLFERGLLGIEVDRQIYDLDVVLRAAYKFADRCHVFIQSSETPTKWLAMLLSRAPTDLVSLAGDFSNELIDQRLRRSLEVQFGDLRTLIVAQAFSEGNLLDVDRSDGDYRADPKGIAAPR